MSAVLAYLLVIVLGVIIVRAVQQAPATVLGAPLLSSYNIILGLFALYMFMPAMMLLVIEGGEYVWLPRYGGYDRIALTAFVTIAALACFLGAYWLRQRASSQSPEFAPLHRPEPVAVLLAWVMIALGLLIKIYTVYAAGGFEESALRLSRGVRDNLGIEDLSSSIVVLRYISGIADAAVVWMMLHSFRSKNINYLHFIIFTLVLGFSYFGTGKRLFLLWPVLALALGFHYYVRPLRVNMAPLAIALVIAAGFASLMFRIYLPAQTAGFEIDLYRVSWAKGSLLSFYFFSLEFSTFEVFTLAIENSDAVIRMFGDSVSAFYITNIEPLSYVVPRVFWPGKPDVLIDISHAYRIFVLGGDLKSGGGIAGTLTATAWTFGGPLGVAVAMLALGYISATMDGARRVRGELSPVGIIWYAFGMVTIFHLFRQGTLGWTAMIVVIQQFGMLAAFTFLGLVDRVPASRRRMAAATRR